ncbi:MAG: ATP-binding protein, partial [Bryobacteraceae bacterium]
MDATVTPALFSFALSVVVHALAGDGGATTAFGKALASLLGEYTGAKGGAAIDKLTRQIAGNLQSANLDPKDSGDLERALRRAYWESILHALMLAAERAGIEVKSPRPPLAFWIARRWEDICSRPQPLNLGPAPVQQVVEDLAKRIEKPDDYREDLPGNINLAAVAEQLLQAGGAQTLSLQCGDHAWSYLEKRIRIWPDLKATFDANWSLCFCHAFQYHFKSETTVYRIVTGQLLTGIDRRLHTLDSRTAELVRGLKRMPTRCDGQIKDFIHYYLGSESRPAPFGGRGWELERLSRWLDDRNAKPYLLVTAPGGRGKSALLAHWASDLSARLGVDHLIYFPVSARYQTNSESTVFSALAAHVNAVNGEGDLGRADAWQYRSIFRDLIEKAPKDGGRVVLVLDGLDEAGWDGWEGVLPAEAPQHLRVMVAARPLLGDSSGEPWIRRLGWEPRDVECIELPLLDVDGVREVLRAMGDPLSGLAIEVDVPGNIHRLSDGGDPLLVGEFVKLLREKAAQPDFRPEQVPQMRPGLKGIFESWLEHQRRIWKQLDSGFKLEAEPRALMVLHLCSFALGPLSLEDMEALAPDQFTSRTGLKAAVRSTERFLAGSLDTGLVFTHPRFGEYWRDQMGDRERAEVQRRFSEYAAGHLRALHASGGKPSEYLVRWAVRHLEQSGELPEFGCLVASVPWFREWQELEGTPSGFLTDLERIERFGENTAAQSKIPLWMRVRTALFRSSILTSERQIPLELFEKAIDAEVLSYPLAKVLAREQYDENRGLYLSVVLRYSPVEEREDLLAEALEAARTTLDESSRSQALSSLASSLIGDLRKEVLSEALRTARAIENEFDRSQALSTMAGSLSAYPDLMAEALSAAWAISYKSDRSQALSAMAGSLSGNLQQEVLTGALSAARAIGDESERSRALSAVARSLCGELQQEVLAEALRAAQGVGDGSDRSLALSALARSLSAYPDLMAEALSAARDIGDESERSRSLSALAGSLSGSLQKEVLAEALRAAQAIGDGFDRSQPLSAMARSLAAHPDLLAEVLRAARAVGNEFGRSLALSALAGSLSGNLQKEVLAEALR